MSPNEAGVPAESFRRWRAYRRVVRVVSVWGSNALLLAGVVLVVLKLAGAVVWSWWWVVSPFAAFFLFTFLVVGFDILVVALLRHEPTDEESPTK